MRFDEPAEERIEEDEAEDSLDGVSVHGAGVVLVVYAPDVSHHLQYLYMIKSRFTITF